MAMPKIEMKPMAADTEKFCPVTSKARTPPVHATGMLTMTRIVSIHVLTALYVKNAMRMTVSGMMIWRRTSAS